MSFSDVVRGYDILYQLPSATMLDRIATLLMAECKVAGEQWESTGYLNAEDEVYLAAALGCSMGIMRHALWAANTDHSTNPIQYHRRITEAVRAVRWQRIAPPVRVRDTPTKLSTELLSDHWFFTPGSTWMRSLIHNFSQTAPARVARNMPHPTVHSHTDPPFVVCSKHPNGAVAVAALQRSLKQQIVALPAAVEIEIGAGREPIGVFGVFDSLTLITDNSPLHQSRIYAQDLATDTAVDITHACKWEGRSLVVPGRVLATLCRQNQHPDDLSLPGVVLRLA